MSTRAEGIDVSHWQGEIDWGRVSADGVSFAFIKATEGDSWIDDKFDFNMYQSAPTGIIPGAYHYFRPDVSPIDQAQHFFDVYWDVSEDFPLDISLPPVLDVESTDDLPPAHLAARVHECLREIERLFGRKPVIYTRSIFWRDQVGAPDWSTEYPFWLAQYADVDSPWLLPGYEWQFWQHTDKGRVDGIEGNVDLDVFNGTVADLRAWLQPDAPVPPEPGHNHAQDMADLELAKSLIDHVIKRLGEG